MSNPFSLPDYSTAGGSSGLPSNPFAFKGTSTFALFPPVDETQPAAPPSEPVVKSANAFGALYHNRVALPEVQKRSINAASLLNTANGAKADFTFGLIDEEINAIEAQKRRDEIEETLRVQDMIHDAAKNNKSYITLPTQSEQSAALSHLVHSYKNAGKHKIQHKASKKNARAARVAENKIEQLEARLSNTGSYKKSMQKNKKKNRKNLSW